MKNTSRRLAAALFASTTIAVVAGASLQAFAGETARDGDRAACHVGIYALRGGGDVDVGLADDHHLRWRRKDGTSGLLTEANGRWTSTLGWTGRSDGKRVTFDSCEA